MNWNSTMKFIAVYSVSALDSENRFGWMVWMALPAKLIWCFFLVCVCTALDCMIGQVTGTHGSHTHTTVFYCFMQMCLCASLHNRSLCVCWLFCFMWRDCNSIRSQQCDKKKRVIIHIIINYHCLRTKHKSHITRDAKWDIHHQHQH